MTAILVLHVALDVGIDRAIIVVLDVVLNVGHLVDGISSRRRQKLYLPVDVSPDFVQVAAAIGSLDVHQHFYPLTLELLVVHFQHQVWLAVRERMRHYNKLGPGGKKVFLTPAQSFRPGRPHQVAVVNDIKVLGLGKWNYWIWRQQKKCRRRLHHGGSNGCRSHDDDYC